jgi:hypothetical protein
MKHLLILAALIAGFAALPACHSTKTTAMCQCDPCTCSNCTCGKAASLGMMNDACPMSGKKLSADCPKSTYDGNTVGFCGNGCKAHFDGMNDTEKQAYIAKMNGN